MTEIKVFAAVGDLLTTSVPAELLKDSGSIILKTRDINQRTTLQQFFTKTSIHILGSWVGGHLALLIFFILFPVAHHLPGLG